VGVAIVRTIASPSPVPPPAALRWSREALEGGLEPQSSALVGDVKLDDAVDPRRLGRTRPPPRNELSTRFPSACSSRIRSPAP
jgi:hypothetical protein